MALNLMYITNNPDVAKIAEESGVDRIFVDMEYIGKGERQGGMDTVQSHHTIEDVKNIKSALTTSELLVRINPIHRAHKGVMGSKEEIDAVIEAGADVIMLPYFTTVKEVEEFIRLVDGRVRTLPLVESKKSVELIDDILDVDGIDEVFIGLNDLSLDMGKKFMFELLSDGTVEKLCLKFRMKGIPFGFGGIAALGKGMLPSEYIIREHYRLGSTCAILSRSFCNANHFTDLEAIRNIFESGMKGIRYFEQECEERIAYFRENEKVISEKIKTIVESM